MKTVISVSGTPYEQGVQEGKELREIIEKNVALVRERMERDSLNNDRYRKFVERNLGFMERCHQDLYQEMKGISDGSGISFEDIIYLNIPAYFMSEYFNQECSMLMVRGKATVDGNTYVIKNRDMSMYIEQAVIKREYPNGLKMVEILSLIHI